MSFGSTMFVEGRRGTVAMGPVSADGLEAWPELGPDHPMFAKIMPEGRGKLARNLMDRAGFVRALAANDGTVHWGLHREDALVGLASLFPSRKRQAMVGRVLVLPDYWGAGVAPQGLNGIIGWFASEMAAGKRVDRVGAGILQENRAARLNARAIGMACIERNLIAADGRLYDYLEVQDPRIPLDSADPAYDERKRAQEVFLEAYEQIRQRVHFSDPTRTLIEF